MSTQEALDRAIAQWLAQTDPNPERIRREWAAQGVALVPLGERFAAVRMAAYIVHAAVRTADKAGVATALGELLGGSIIHDRRVGGGTYYALIQGHAGLVWAYDDLASCLGHGTYLGIPRLDRQQPPGTYWVVPPRFDGDLCAPRDITALMREGRGRLAEQMEAGVSGASPEEARTTGE
ncbi:hypothetical protein ACFFKE_28135 [Streptomyces mutabilis]|uniref:hypothetical protein n=1 Tax=Streptomyces mutabilis TaxID=67332 RepID=UPI00177FDA0B|nr:hypothetical protein [Streptomyces mutabilis]GGQ02441.1 hypothetical protein GCM10010279_07100 [Streptomyces mutabilis]